ncbi:MAG TPA: GNAT family N-acetyltransferase [Egibacteraceae bacterium]|nr:GNAT family N-acetyltransferase [Egibacteraceae bacterium]
MSSADTTVRPLSPDRWDDLVLLFGDRGAYSGCWCMWWRITGREFEANGNAGNRARFQALVDSGSTPGLLAYRDGRPVGWCAVAPREQQPRLQRSPTLKPLDDEPGVWAVSCFFTHRAHRGTGVARALLDAAVGHAAEHGARIVEGYPVDRQGRLPAAEAFTGTVELFASAGFTEAGRRSQRQPIMRRGVAIGGH